MKWGAEAKALVASFKYSILYTPFRTLSDTADMSGPAAWPAPGESYTESSSCSRAGPSTGNWSEIFFEPVKMLALNIYSALSRPRSTIYPHRNIAMSSWWWSHGSSDREWKVWQDYTWLNISAQLRSSSTLGHVYSYSRAPAGVIIILSPSPIVLILLGSVSPPSTVTIASAGAGEATHHMFRFQTRSWRKISFTEKKSPEWLFGHLLYIDIGRYSWSPQCWHNRW